MHSTPTLAVASPNGATADELPYYGRMEWTLVTPELAKALLGLNRANRSLRPHRVKMYASDMAAGLWTSETATPIQVFGDELKNGQHRLNAIVLADMNIWSWVQYLPARGQDKAAIIDTALTRSARDIFGVTTNIAAASRVLAIMAGPHNNVISLSEVHRVAERIAPEHERLTGTSRRGFTIAAVQAAVCFSMWRYPDDADEIVMQYNAEARDENGRVLWPGFHSAARQVMQRSTGGRVTNLADIFLRVARGLDPEGRRVEKVAFKDQTIYRGKIRPMVAEYVGRE